MSLGSSRLLTLAPTSLLIGIVYVVPLRQTLRPPGTARSTLLPHSLCRILDRFHDVLIARAAAEIAIDGAADLLFCRILPPLQKLVGGKNHPRRTVAALQTVALPKTFLQRMEILTFSQSFNGHDFTAIGLYRQNGT